MVHDSQVKFRVSQVNIFQETKKSQINYFTSLNLYKKSSDSTAFYVKNG